MKQSSPLTRDLHLFADGVELAQGCRIFLQSQETLALTPHLFQLEILNLPDSSAARLAAAETIEVQSTGSILASGTRLDVFTRPEAGKTLTTVSFSPGYAFWSSSVSLSVSAGVPLSESIRAVLQASGSAVPLAAFRAEDRRLTRPQSFFGRTSDALSVLAAAAGAEACLTSAGLCVLNHAPAQPSLILLPEALLSAPVKTADSWLLTTDMTGWPLGAWVRCTWQGATHTGRLISRMIQADNVSGPWKSELELEK